MADEHMNVPDTPLGNMYREHIKLILEKNIDALLAQYTDDAILISSFEKTPKYFRGAEELKEHFKGILGIEGLKTRIAFWAETEGTLPDEKCLMIVEEIEMTAGGQEAKMRFADSWVLRGGRIAIHFAGMTQYPDGSVA